MKGWIYCILGLIVACALYPSCSSDDVEEIQVGSQQEYYPIQEGLSTIYRVDSIIFRNFDTSRIEKTSYIREFLESTFTDTEGNTNYRILRYLIDSVDNNPIERLTDVWQLTLRPNFVERNEENIRFRILSLPLVINASWDGHAFISDSIRPNLQDWIYRYSSIINNYTDSITQNSFSDLIEVSQTGAVSNLVQNSGNALYARGIGLIYKETFSISGQNCVRYCGIADNRNSPNCNDPGSTLCALEATLEEWANDGFIERIRYISHEIL